MKKHRLSFVLVSLLILTSIVGIFSLNGLSAETLDFTFEKDVLYSENNPVYDDDFNIRNQTQFTGHYPATYSFENEVGLFGKEISYIDNDTPNHSAIVNVINGHNEVLSYYDDDGASAIRHDLDVFIDAGRFELWWCSNDVSINNMRIQLREGSNIIYYLRFVAGFIQSDDGATNLITTYDNIWYNLGIEFFINNTVNIYINGGLALDGDCFTLNDTVGIDNIVFYMYSNDNTVFSYYDAIGSSWDEAYTGESFDVSSQDIHSGGITWDGEYFWMVGDEHDKLYKYDSDGVYTGINFDINEDLMSAIEWDGEYFWMVGYYNLRVYKYNSSGIYMGINFEIDSETLYPNGITWDGEYFWISDSWTDRIYKYDSDGVYTGFSFDVSSEANITVQIFL